MAELGELETRLRDHAKAFDGLLSLIPAKMYYGADTSQQWKKTKQTKEEAAAARRNRLDPDSRLNWSVREVMDEKEAGERRKRKFASDDGGEQESVDGESDGVEDVEGVDGVEREKPGEGMRKRKKQKKDEDEPVAGADAEKEVAKENTTEAGSTEAMTKKQRKKQKKQKKEEKRREKSKALEEQRAEKQTQADEAEDEAEDMAPLDVAGLEATDPADASTPSSAQSPTFDVDPKTQAAEASSIATSISSLAPDTKLPAATTAVPPSAASSTTSTKSKPLKIPADTTLLRARLAAKISTLRAARKADGPDGKPIRTRQQLIEARRAKEAQRKAHKKELRAKARLEEELRRDEALASVSPMSPAVELDDPAESFAFGRVAFGDGAVLSRDLTYELKGGKKGARDVKTALKMVQGQKKRLEEMDEGKRAEIEDKEAWLTARRRAEGEKIRDDEDKLKKAVKRKDAAKKKSEREWKDRVKGVEKAGRDRQKRREENIRKRKEEKGRGKGKKGKGGGGAKGKRKPRPGFEGGFSKKK